VNAGTNGILAFHAFAFLGQIIYGDVLKGKIRKIKNIVHAASVYGQLVQTVRGTVTITCTWILCHYITRTGNEKCITCG